MKLYIDIGPPTHANNFVDYTQSVVDQSLVIEDSINVPVITNFSLVALGSNWALPRRSSYVKIVSEIYGKTGGYLTPGQSPLTAGKVLATGFISNEPERSYLGLNGALPQFKGQQLNYKINMTSDDWFLNTEMVPWIPAFVDQTQGQILASLAEALRPGFFDVTSFVASGDIVPYFQYDPQQSWSDIAKTFADASRYRYQVIDRVIYFEPFGDQPLGIRYDETGPEKSFFPLDMQTSVLTVPPVNDALVLGGEEAQDKWDSYFVGDGFTSNFKLRHNMFRGTSVMLLTDDWTETSFQTNLWNVQDPQGIFTLIGALNVNQLGLPSPLNQEYILGLNGLELGGALDVQHGEFEFVDVCQGIVGGIYSSTTLIQANCVAGFLLSGGVAAPSGAIGVTVQPILNGQPVGPPLALSQQNHHYQLETWIGASDWTRYEAAYRTLAGTTQYGGLKKNATADVTFVVRDLDLGFIIAQQYNNFVQTGGVGIPLQVQPTVNQYTVTGASLPSFGVYAPINAQNLNLTLQFTQISQPPQGTLIVASLSGASATQLPVVPGGGWWSPQQNLVVYGANGLLQYPAAPNSILGPPVVYSLGFGLANPTATIQQTGNTDFLSFFTDTIPGVGARIRFISWANGQAMSRVQDPIAIAQEAVISGDNGNRSAILTSLQPQPRTSDECEMAAGAAILDREYPQFQGTYTVFTIPFRYEIALNPSGGDYPRTGRYLYVNAPMRAISGQNFFANTIRTQIVELREEILQVEVSYGPDQYLEKLLTKFIQRPEPNILGPTELQIPPNPIALSQVGSFYVPMFASGQVTAFVNALSGNYITVDLGAPPVQEAEVRRVDTGWGQNDQNLIGLFTTQQFNLPRTNRDQTWYIRPRTGSQTSRFSYTIRANVPMIPSPPAFISLGNETLTLGLNGDIRDIYGVELRLPGVSGSYVINFAVGPVAQPQNMTGPTQEVNYFQRLAFVDDTTNWNTLADVPQIIGSQQFGFQTGDIVLVSSPVNSSVNGLKVLTGVSQLAGYVPTMVPNAFGNYVDTWIWPNLTAHHFGDPGYPLSTGSAIDHQVGNSLSLNPPNLGQGFDPNVQPAQWEVWGPDDNTSSFKTLSSFARQLYDASMVFRLQVPAAGNYTFSITHDDGMFFGINNGASLVSGPNVNTAPYLGNGTNVGGYPVLGGRDSQGVATDIFVVNFPAAGAYDAEIDFFQFINEQTLGVDCIFAPLIGNLAPASKKTRIRPGYLERLQWIDVGQSFPLSFGADAMPFTQAGSVTLQARNAFAQLTSGSVSNGLATVVTQSAHGFNPGDTIVMGARVTPLAAAGGSQDGSTFTGQWTLTATPSANSFQFTAGGNLPGTLASTNLIGVASVLIRNIGQPPPASGQLVTLNAQGVIVQRPVFAPSDLIFDLQDPAIKNVLQVAQILNPSGFTINAYFFNLTWDYSTALDLSNITVPVISGLMVDPYTQQAMWGIVSGVPTGYRIDIQDPVTSQTFNTFTTDHPHNIQALTSFKLLPSDYNNVRNIIVTPFNALGDGPAVQILHTGAVTASGVPVTEAYVIHSVVNGYIISGQVIVRTPFDQAVIYSIDMVPSQAWIDQPPSTGQLVFSIQQFDLGVNGGNVGVEIGCLTFTAGSHVGTYSVPAGGNFPVRDVLKFIAVDPHATGSGDGAGIGLSITGVIGFATNPTLVPPVVTQPGVSGGVVDDILNWYLPPLAFRSTQHVHGNATKYFALDTDASQASVASTHGFNWFALIKGASGHPADVLRYDGSFLYHELTEDSANFSVANAYKRILTPFKSSPRFVTLGGPPVVIDTPGPNTFILTQNCEATSTSINLGDVREITYGPVIKDFHGNIGVQPAMVQEHYYGGTIASGIFQDKEVFYLVLGFGQVEWDYFKLSGGSYVLQQSSINSAVAAGGAPTLAFACVPGPTWW